MLAYEPDGGCDCLYDPGLHAPAELDEDQRAFIASAEAVCITVGPARATREALALARANAPLAWVVKADPRAVPGDLAAALTARYGNSTLTAPRYDIEAARDQVHIESVADASWGEPRPRSAEDNAAGAAAPPIPTVGSSRDTSLFQYVRAVPAGAAGLLAVALDAPIVQGSTRTREREELFDAFRRGELRTLVVSKVANFSIDLPEASVAVQVSGTFGSRKEEAQRLRAEDPERIANWIRRTIEVVPADQVGLSTDCALSSVRRIVARKKLANMVAGAEIVRAELEGR